MADLPNVGDRAIIIGGGCACTQSEIGMIVHVDARAFGPARCARCNKRVGPQDHLMISYDDGDIAWKPPSWLRRLPTDGELVAYEIHGEQPSKVAA